MRKLIKLLIVDDNPADYNLIRRKAESGLRTRSKVHCHHGEDSDACLQALRSQEFHCIILDYLLGAENGIDVLKKILKAKFDIPVVMMTGEGDESVAVEAMKLGAFDYLIKQEATDDGIALAVNNAIAKADLKRSLRDKQRELEDFAYTAAHDIKSPLATINQTSQLLKLRADELNDPEVMNHAEVLFSVSKNLASFVTELLEYAKVGRLDRKFKTLNLRDIIDKALVNLETVIKNEGVAIEIDANLPVIKGDEIALMQFFQNLISNGIKFKKPGVPPVIKIYSRELNKSELGYDFKICVRDNGIGIAPEHQKRIFSPLVRLHSNDEFEGSGLGLAISKKIISQHLGDLWIESVPGESTTVCVLLKSNPNPST